MSAQSIKHKTISGLKEEAEKSIIKSANDYLLKRLHSLGEGHCDFYYQDTSFVYEIIQTNNCDLLNLLNKVIEEGSQEYSESFIQLNQSISTYYNETGIPPNTNTLYKLWLSRGNTGSMDDFLDILLSDEKVELEQDNWS